MALQDRRVKFLNQASQLLYPANPSISAELSYDSLSLRAKFPSSSYPEQSNPLCGACGSLRSISRTSTEPATPPKAFKLKSSSHQRPKHKRILVQRCSHCLRISRTPFDPPHLNSQMAIETTKPETASEQVATLRNTGKQRAKARKDRESLQALLNKNKREATSINFDLMDFLDPRS